MDAVERDRRQGRRPPGLEAAGQVVLAETEDDPGEDAAAARDDPPAEPPVDDPAARGVARADDEVGRVRRRSGRSGRAGRAGSWLKSASIWTTVVAPPASATREAVEVGAAEALLEGAMADPDPRVGGGQRVGQPSGAVGRAVVDDEQRRGRQRREDGGRDRPDVLGLVVGRQDDPDARARPRASATAAAVGDGSVIDAKSRRRRPRYGALTTMVRVMVDEPIQLVA